jgi:GTP-binding protein HflX
MTTAFGERTEMDAATGELDLEDRHALRRVVGLSTELTDITEVEYRALRLERVVLVGVWTDGSTAEAANSLRELSRLAETAGSVVLDGLIRLRQGGGAGRDRRRDRGGHRDLRRRAQPRPAAPA